MRTKEIKLLVWSSVKTKHIFAYVFILFYLRNHPVTKIFFNTAMTGNIPDIIPKRKDNSSIKAYTEINS